MTQPSIDDLLADLAEQLRKERVRQRMDQAELAAKAGISRTAVSRLERGIGGQVHTLLAILRALGQAEWLKTLAPTVDVDPLLLLRRASTAPQRVKRTKEEIDQQP